MSLASWLKDTGGGVLEPKAASIANPLPVQVAGFAFNGDFIVQLNRTVTAAAASIANAGTLSAAVSMGEGRLVGLQMAAAWTAAALSFDGSIDGGATYAPIYDGATERSISSADMTTLVGKTLALDANDWRAFTHIKLRSGLNGATVAQGALRAIVAAVEGGI